MDNKKDLYILIATLVIFIGFVFMMNKCSEYKTRNDKSIITSNGDKEYITKTEHIYHTDTVFQVKHIKIPVPRIDTVEKIVYADTNNCRRIYIYQDSLVDSNIVFYYKDYIQGTLRDKKMSYKLKVPIRIIDTISITDKVFPKFNASIGFEVGLNLASPIINIGYEKGNVILGYNLLTKTPQVGFTYRIINK